MSTQHKEAPLDRTGELSVLRARPQKAVGVTRCPCKLSDWGSQDQMASPI